jgi:hypothetical protein
MRSSNSKFETRNSKLLPRTYTRQQQKLREEFCSAYNFAPEQIGFDGSSLDPIFDFDALSVLSVKLCNLPHVDVDFGSVEHSIDMATSRGYAVLPNGNTRKIFGTAVVGETMHDGRRIENIHQAVKVSRARALRTILRAVGFDPVAAHREHKQTGNVIELQLPSTKFRNNELAECHILGQRLGYIVRDEKGKLISRTQYDNLMATYFQGQTSTGGLEDNERATWLGMLRAWASARDVAEGKSRGLRDVNAA